ncbi:M16 family metallopeptidase [Mucilaginibacter ginsenosidivorans]|uniref:Insulinase family protein n=1 Tax=Mucilaginibacter ginsenosidivorans TaxID=398053 RepID=A0A5B8US99_9SPHI|nr:insulinase family protein [Mucilaginibacter ginsenosidivorans]QEC61306.1 insulinase family protein [Mucilaginibacter ginsenosidivorans]
MNLNRKLSLAAIALFVTATCSFAQVKKKPVPSPRSKPVAAAIQLKGDLLPVDPNVIIGKLPNGLTYYIRKNTEPKNRAELYLVNKAGSVLETDPQQGLAHFTEHMAFNGTRDFPKNELVSYLQKAGVKFGADLNAYTSFDETVYQLPLPTDSTKVFEKGFDILADWAGHVTFDPKEIDAERGVVLEEERLRGKNAQERLQHQILPVLLNNSRYAARLPIGKEDILKTFKPETIKSFYHDWYRPDLQAVIAVGDFDPKHVEQLIKDNFSDLKNPAGEKPRTQYSVPTTPGTQVKIATDKEFPYTLAEIIVRHPETKMRTTADYLQGMRNDIFNQMLNARLSELTQKANPPFLFGRASYGGFIGHQDAFTSIAVAKPGELETAIKAVVAETERARKFGFTETEFERAKQDALTQMENAYKERDKTKSVRFVQEYQQNFLQGEAIPGIEYEYNFYKDNIGRIKLSEINALAGKYISDKNRAVIVEAPDKEKDKLPNEKTLLEWISTAGKDVKPYVDNVSNKPLLEKEPTAGKTVSIDKDTAIMTTTLTLSNGVKVILKPTTFKNDQILINGYHFGGTSLASDEDFTSANLAAGIIGSSGLADFNEIQLEKMLSGKNVSISPYIRELSEGINGSSSPKDFETALQLVYLYFTQPRKDPDIWQSNITQTKSLLANRSLDPTSVFQDTVSSTLSNHNFRRMVTTVDRLNSASLDKAYSFYKQRFSDANGFTFVLVGSFDAEKIKPLLEKYLGGLPSSGGNKTYKDLGIHIPAGQLTKEVHKGIGDKSSVQLVFSGPYDYSEANNIQVDALEEVLNIKLIERLREKEGGVYAPGVRANYSKLPSGRYSISVYFGCAPANVDKLIAATLDEINKIKNDGPEAVDIQKFKAETTRSIEVQLKENSFWEGHLTASSQNQSNPDDALKSIANLDQATVSTVKDAANKYLNESNFIKLILLPEKAK